MKKALLYTDGGSRGNPGPSAAGWVLYDDEGKTISKSGAYTGEQTNNFAEYMGLIYGLELAIEESITSLWVRMDSNLIIEQMKGNWKVKNMNIRPLFEKAKFLEESFEEISFEHIRRDKNTVADAMVNEALDSRL